MLAEHSERVNEAVCVNDAEWNARMKENDESWSLLVEVGHTVTHFDLQLIRTLGKQTHNGRDAKETSRRARRGGKTTG